MFFERMEKQMAKAIVAGSANMDVVLSVSHAPKGGESIFCDDMQFIGGGKGSNQAIALARLGMDTAFFGCVGNDQEGDALVALLTASGVDTSLVMRCAAHTGMAYVILERGGENRIIVSPGANESITLQHIEALRAQISKAEIVLLQLEIPLEVVSALIQVCRQEQVRVVVDAGPIRGCTPQMLRGAYCVSPNQSELSALLGKEITSEQDMIEAAKELLTYDIDCILLKLGSRGCMYIDHKQTIALSAFRVDVVDTTAAGDSFTAGFAAALMEGMDIPSAMEYANKCGSVAVTRMGASSSLPSKEDIENFSTFLKK